MGSDSSSRLDLKVLFRLIGSSSLLALIFVVAPRSWMESIHLQSGMGQLPEGPVVGYLARSLSAFYALMGGLFWVISFDLDRNRIVVSYLGRAIVILGVILIGVDWWEGLPFFWKLWEGPFMIVMGLLIWSWSRRLA